MQDIQVIDAVFNQIFRTLKDDVKKISMKYCDYDYHIAEDATQYAFIQLYKKFVKEGVDSIEDYRAYLVRVAKNNLLNYSRDNAKMSYGDDSGLWEAVDQVLDSAEEEYIDGIDQCSQFKSLLKIKEHNETWYYILVEVFLRERSQKEVAADIGVPEASMYATIRKIRRWAEKNLPELQN